MGKSKRKKDSSKQANDDTEIKRQELIQKVIFLEQQCEIEEKAKEEFEKRIKDVTKLWEMDKKELEQKQHNYDEYKAELKHHGNLHERTIDELKDQIRQRLYEQVQEMTESKNESVRANHLLQDELESSHKSIEADIAECHGRHDEMQVSHNAFLIKLRHDHDNRISSLRDIFRHNSKDLTLQAERDIKRMKESFESSMMRDTEKLDSGILEQSKRLTDAYEKNLEQLRKEMNKQIKVEVDQIKQLKRDSDEKKRIVHKTEKMFHSVTESNKEIMIPLQEAERDINKYAKDREEMKEQKDMMLERKEDLVQAEENLKNMQWKHEVLLQQYEVAVKERNQSLKRVEAIKNKRLQEIY